MAELHLRDFVRAGDRRGRAGRGRGGQGDVPLSCEKARSGVKPDPARARHVDLAPGVKVGEIRVRARWAVDRLDVGR